ncbi:hypothetical protein P4O66_006684 [Electrophorus voltai]|uniref:Uncharacterized protein n=1 Tax=Electrophorus voltai TaxID=2609070 RepID=A0AAD8ZJ14_9TELE|nr:hypothetical protein P4O66_006684 [Electrophorus voltai]
MVWGRGNAPGSNQLRVTPVEETARLLEKPATTRLLNASTAHTHSAASHTVFNADTGTLQYSRQFRGKKSPRVDGTGAVNTASRKINDLLAISLSYRNSSDSEGPGLEGERGDQ